MKIHSFAVVLLGLLCLATHPVWAAGQPNVVIVLADDMGWKDVGYNGSVVQTPNIDRLASNGVVLQRYYAQPTCSPTRSSLMTGQAALRVGVVQPIDKNLEMSLPLSLTLMPQYFQQAGYQTSLVGKWHLGHAYRTQLPMARGFDHAYGGLLGGIGHWSHTHGGGLDWHRNGRALREEGYSSHLITQEAISRIRARDPERPIFMYVSFAAPHLPNEAPAEAVEQYAQVANPHRRVHAAMVSELDRGIGAIVSALEAEGILDNTLIWFMSDNGGLLPGSGVLAVDVVVDKLVDWFGQPLPLEALEFLRSNIQDGGSDNGPYRRGKTSVYEGGVLVPSVLSWPGMLAQREVAGRVTAQDVLPTLAEVAGLQLPDSHTLDGSSRWPTIRDGASVPPPDYVTVGIDGEALYQQDWKLVVISGDAELYDLRKDPVEANNLAAQFPERVATMQQQLDAFPRGESIHTNSLLDIFLDPDKFGGEEDRPPWVEQVRTGSGL